MMKFESFDYQGRHSASRYFSSLAALPHALLLQSGGVEPEYNRFDIILSYPRKVMKLVDGKATVLECNEDAEGIERSIDDCFETLNEWLDSAPNDFSELPFSGGVAGALAYDLGRSLEVMPESADKIAQVPDLVLGLYEYPLIIDHQNQTVRLYDFSNANSHLEPYIALRHRLKEAVSPSQTSEPFSLTESWQSNLTKSDYAQRFAAVKEYIAAGDCYQINLAQRFTASFEGDPWHAYQHLSKINEAPFSCYFNMGNIQLLSLSPERFIQHVDGKVITQPIKGTRPRGATEAEDHQLQSELITSEKDRAENLMIVDLLRNDLGRTAAPGSVKVSELFGLYSFPSVHHLISTVEASKAHGMTNADVIKHAFPGGSITGAPKIRAMEIIEQLEPHRRHFYCGSVCYFSFNGKMDSNILIRSLLVKDQTIYTWAGGGLVDDSECNDEYAETFSKLSKILEPLTRTMC